MNYIKHLTGFFDRVVQDSHLNPTHISLYIGLFQYWNVNRFQNPISITRDEIMRISKICSKATYHKCMRELNDKGYIKYEPSYNPFKGSMVILFNFSDDLKPSQKKDITSSKILPLSEQVVNKQRTSNKTSTEQALVPSINYINKTNILNDLNLGEQEKNFENEENNFLEDENNLAKEKKLRKKKKSFSDSPTQSKNQNGGGKGLNAPSDEDVKQFFQEQNFPELEAKKFYNYFSSNGWLVGGKTPMVDWKAAAQNWMLNFDKFNTPESAQAKTSHLTTSTDKNYAEPL